MMILMLSGNLIWEVLIKILWYWGNSKILASIGLNVTKYLLSIDLFYWCIGMDIKKDFPIFDQNPWLVYLDNASTTQKPQFVIDAVSTFVSEKYANVHRGNYTLSAEAEEIYMQSKKMVAKCIGAEMSEIAYHYNATAVSNMVAQALCYSKKIGKWDTVLLWVWDHHATTVVWQQLQKLFGFRIDYIPLAADQYSIDWDALNTMIDDSVKVVVCSHVSNVTGTIYDMKKIRSLLHDDVFFMVDASQSVPNFSVDVQDIWCDCLFFTAHKMLAYTGLWVMYLQKRHISSLEPLCVGGGVIEDVTTQWHTLKNTIERWEAGTPNIIGAVSLLASLRYIDRIGGYGTIQQIERENIAYVLEKVKDLPEWIRLVGTSDVDGRVGVFSFVTDENPIDIADRLAEEDICVRVGWHCSHPLIYAMWHKQLLRMSCYIYTSKEDIDRFFAVLVQKVA